MGSEGGNARKEKLSPEQRKAIAKSASDARWAKVRKAKEDAAAASAEAAPPPQPAPVAPEPPPAPVTRRRQTARPMPKAFKGASSYAEKRLAEAIKERAEYMGRVAALNAEIPSLVSVIRALGGNPNISPASMQSYPLQDGSTYPMPMVPPVQQPMADPAQAPNIDPALFRTNGAPIPGLNPPANPIIPNTAVGGAMDLDYTPSDDEPRRPGGGGGWQ